MPAYKGFFTKLNIPAGGYSYLAGLTMLACFAGLLTLPSLRGPHVITFLALFLLAGSAYVLAVILLDRDRLPLISLWTFAILFRLVVLFTEPTLSDDVFRYIWDGHLLSQWINPYALPVNSTLLDSISTDLRDLVNHSWMTSPYLPSSQLLFTIVHLIAPESVKAFQITSLILDLMTAWLVMDMLALVRISKRQVLLYIWNPLVVIEFSHGAHVVDALMIFLVMLTFWFLIKAKPGLSNRNWLTTASSICLAAATLTKGIPLILLSVVWRRWGWKRLLLYATIIIAVIIIFTIEAGLGLTGDLDGKGVFGALRIYLTWWNFNSGIYHWLEVGLSGYQTPGAVPVEIVGEGPIQLAKMITGSLLALVVLFTTWLSWRLDISHTRDHTIRTLELMRLAILPTGAYILFTSTVNPWYITLILPFLPFLTPLQTEPGWIKRSIWPWIYFSLAVSLSYLTYINPDDFRELYFVRQIEYIPLYVLIVWALWPVFIQRKDLLPTGISTN